MPTSPMEIRILNALRLRVAELSAPEVDDTRVVLRETESYTPTRDGSPFVILHETEGTTRRRRLSDIETRFAMAITLFESRPITLSESPERIIDWGTRLAAALHGSTLDGVDEVVRIIPTTGHAEVRDIETLGVRRRRLVVTVLCREPLT